MRKLLFILLALVSFNLNAGDSGMYFNPDRNGEGLDMIRNGETVVFFFYSYEPNQGCWNIKIPDSEMGIEGICHEQRWFFGSGDKLSENGNALEGWLYSTVGLDYPFGVVNQADPFKYEVGKALIVGRYVMVRYGEGWRMAVVQFGEVLDEDDPLYERIYEFTTPLLKGTD